MVKDEVGNHYGRLTVIKRAENNKHNAARWLCRCICGKETIVDGQALRAGNTKSCGCLNEEVREATCRKRSLTHGMTGSRLYYLWTHMKQRTQNPKNSKYKYYGGRGITLCEEWQKFEPFRDWSMQNGYNDNLTIDRINNDGPYSPSNCRWTTTEVQLNNRRDNVFLEFNGKKQTIAQWARELKMNVTTLWMRLYHYNWPIEEAFTKPSR